MSSATAPDRVSAAPSLVVTLENCPEAAAVARDAAGDLLKGWGLRWTGTPRTPWS